MIELKYFEGDLWVLDRLKWTNISSKTKTARDREYYIKGMIREHMVKTGTKPWEIENKKINSTYTMLMQKSVYNNNISVHDINTKIILTNNKIIDLEEKTIDDLDIKKKIPFTPYQINIDIPDLSEAETEEQKANVELARRFMKELTQGDINMERLLFEIIGTSMSPNNESIFPIFYSPHKSSGKGTIMDIIGNINGLTREIKGDKWWSEGNNFSLSSIRNQLVGWIDEVPASLPKSSTEKIKSYSDDKRFLEIERKGIDQERMLNTTTFIATTNHKTELYSVDDSIKGRMIWIEFGMNLYGKPKFTIKEIDTIKNSKECLAYFAEEGIKAYLKALKREGTRKERYTKVESDSKFWNKIKDDSVIIEIFESSEVLSLLWDTKEKFLQNKDLRLVFENWKLKNKDNRITFKGFQNEILSYLPANKLGTAERGKLDNERGIFIYWAKDNNNDPLVPDGFGNRIRKSELEKIEKEQFEIVQKLERENNEQ